MVKHKKNRSGLILGITIPVVILLIVGGWFLLRDGGIVQECNEPIDIEGYINKLNPIVGFVDREGPKEVEFDYDDSNGNLLFQFTLFEANEGVSCRDMLLDALVITDITTETIRGKEIFFGIEGDGSGFCSDDDMFLFATQGGSESVNRQFINEYLDVMGCPS